MVLSRLGHRAIQLSMHLFFTLQGEGSIMTCKRLRQKREERKASHIVLFPVNIQTLEHSIYVGMA